MEDFIQRFFNSINENDMFIFLNNDQSKCVGLLENGNKCIHCYTIAVAHNQKLLLCNSCNNNINSSWFKIDKMDYSEIYNNYPIDFYTFKNIMNNRVNNYQNVEDINMHTYKRGYYENENIPNKKIKR